MASRTCKLRVRLRSRGSERAHRRLPSASARCWVLRRSPRRDPAPGSVLGCDVRPARRMTRRGSCAASRSDCSRYHVSPLPVLASLAWNSRSSTPLLFGTRRVPTSGRERARTEALDRRLRVRFERDDDGGAPRGWRGTARAEAECVAAAARRRRARHGSSGFDARAARVGLARRVDGASQRSSRRLGPGVAAGDGDSRCRTARARPRPLDPREARSSERARAALVTRAPSTALTVLLLANRPRSDRRLARAACITPRPPRSTFTAKTTAPKSLVKPTTTGFGEPGAGSWLHAPQASADLPRRRSRSCKDKFLDRASRWALVADFAKQDEMHAKGLPSRRRSCAWRTAAPHPPSPVLDEGPWRTRGGEDIVGMTPAVDVPSGIFCTCRATRPAKVSIVLMPDRESLSAGRPTRRCGAKVGAARPCSLRAHAHHLDLRRVSFRPHRAHVSCAPRRVGWLGGFRLRARRRVRLFAAHFSFLFLPVPAERARAVATAQGF